MRPRHHGRFTSVVLGGATLVSAAVMIILGVERIREEGTQSTNVVERANVETARRPTALATTNVIAECLARRNLAAANLEQARARLEAQRSPARVFEDRLEEPEVDSTFVTRTLDGLRQAGIDTSATHVECRADVCRVVFSRDEAIDAKSALEADGRLRAQLSMMQLRFEEGSTKPGEGVLFFRFGEGDAAP